MLQFFDLLFNFVSGVWTVVFADTVFVIGDQVVSYGDLIITALIIICTINVFWKGAKA